MDLLPGFPEGGFPDEGDFLPCCFPTRGILEQAQITLTGPTRPCAGVQWRTMARPHPNYS